MDLRGPLTRGALAVAAAVAIASASLAADRPDHSEAERLMFMSEHLAGVKPPATLRYRFRHSGSLEASYEDTVAIVLTREPDGSCCRARGEFLAGERRLELPEIEGARANPVLLYFLEHDVRDMKRITRGSPSYYRKRIRMALYEGATVTEVQLPWRGRTVRARQIDIDPYRDDPARSRFERFARKRYRFLLAEAVPGGVYGIRTVMQDEDPAAAPLVIEEMFIEGATAPKP